MSSTSATASSGSIAATDPPTVSAASCATDCFTRARAIDAELVVPDDGADPAHLAGAGQHRRAGLGELLADAVEVQQHQPARRPAQVVHPRHGLLAAVAALVQVDGAGQPLQLVRDGAVVAVHAEPGTAGLDAQRLVGLRRPRVGPGGQQPVGDRTD